jgi:hypothetical protein
MNSRKRATLDFWIELSVVSLVCALLIFATIYSATRPLDAEDLAINAGDLRSLSSAGSLVSDQFTNGKLTETFFRDQVELTLDKVRDIRDTLETSAVEPTARVDADRLNQLAGRVEAAFDHLPNSGRELKDLSASLKILEENLKQGAEKK